MSTRGVISSPTRTLGRSSRPPSSCASSVAITPCSALWIRARPSSSVVIPLSRRPSSPSARYTSRSTRSTRRVRGWPSSTRPDRAGATARDRAKRPRSASVLGTVSPAITSTNSAPSAAPASSAAEPSGTSRVANAKNIRLTTRFVNSTATRSCRGSFSSASTRAPARRRSLPSRLKRAVSLALQKADASSRTPSSAQSAGSLTPASPRRPHPRAGAPGRTRAPRTPHRVGSRARACRRSGSRPGGRARAPGPSPCPGPWS